MEMKSHLFAVYKQHPAHSGGVFVYPDYSISVIVENQSFQLEASYAALLPFGTDSVIL